MVLLYARAWHQGHHGVRGLLTATLCDLSHSFALLAKFKAGKAGGESVSALLHSRTLTEFSGQSCAHAWIEWSNSVPLSGAILRHARIDGWACEWWENTGSYAARTA